MGNEKIFSRAIFLETIKKKGFNQSDIAKRLCIRKSALSKWGVEGQSPRFENLIKLCEILDCAIDDLMCYTGEHGELPEDNIPRNKSLDQIYKHLIKLTDKNVFFVETMIEHLYKTQDVFPLEEPLEDSLKKIIQEQEK
jgi:DNA-binding Xre family transcriptional regulator